MRALYNSSTNTYTYNVMMKRSFDGGATWSTAQSIAAFNPISTIYSYDVGFDVSNSPHIAVDNNGDLHLVYVTRTSTGDTEIMYRKITNCTSSTQSCELQSVVNLSNNSKDQWEPAIVVSRSNIVHVTALDKRDAANNNSWWRLYHYHCHLSTSACTSSSDWYYVRVTNEGTYVYNMFANKVGHYHGITSSIASTNAREAYTTWTDSRLYNNNQDYNIFYDRLSSSN